MAGKKIYNHGVNLDKETLEQFKSCYSEDFVVSAALMPDAHLGYAAPIGAVLKTKDVVVPAWVGFDIGCGMVAIKISGKDILSKVKENKEEIYGEIRKTIPMGVGKYNKENNVSEKTRQGFDKIFKKLEKNISNKNLLNEIKNSSMKNMGTLGSGNHFIELGYDEKEALWLIIHSGSRGVGHSVAKRYMISASKSGKKENYEKTFPLDTNSEIGKEYLNVLKFGLEYALLNRLEIANRVVESMESILGIKIRRSLWVNKNHNHAILEEGFFIHRKGATPAKKGERGVIPGNMRDGSFLVLGKGNSKFLNSSSHGAGRSISRKGARSTYSLEEFRKSMKDVMGTVSEKTLDELPMAYKDIFKVMDAQKASVKIVSHVKPIINWKGE